MDRVMRAGKIVCTDTLFVPGSPATYEFGERSPNLSWSHHLKVADRQDRQDWVARAEAEGGCGLP